MERGDNMNLQLVRLSDKYRTQLIDMMDEWIRAGEKIIPYAIRKNDYRDFDRYLAGLYQAEEGDMPDVTYFCLDVDRDIFVGAVNICPIWNDGLLKSGGNIGDGVRPSERRRGVATQMISLALEQCRELGIAKVLMICARDNIGSAKSIRNNGGILEKEMEMDGEIVQKYWIDVRKLHHR